MKFQPPENVELLKLQIYELTHDVNLKIAPQKWATSIKPPLDCLQKR